MTRRRLAQQQPQFAVVRASGAEPIYQNGNMDGDPTIDDEVAAHCGTSNGVTEQRDRRSDDHDQRSGSGTGPKAIGPVLGVM